MEDNLKLWNQVCETDPKYTKGYDNGKYKGTTTDPQHQLQNATRQWGPYGAKWGLRNLVFQIMDTSEHKKDLVLIAEFFWPDGSFPIAVDVAYRHSDDAYKKVMTSARSKALAYLGFNADIFLGKFDDNHYVSGMKVKHTSEDELRKTVLSDIRKTENLNALEARRNRVNELRDNGAIPYAIYCEAIQTIEERGRELGSVPFPPPKGEPKEPEQKPTQGLQSILGKVEMCNTIEEIKELKAAIEDDPTIGTEDRIEINAAIKQVFQELYSTDGYSE